MKIFLVESGKIKKKSKKMNIYQKRFSNSCRQLKLDYFSCCCLWKHEGNSSAKNDNFWKYSFCSTIYGISWKSCILFLRFQTIFPNFWISNHAINFKSCNIIIIRSQMHFRVNPHSIITWMSRNSLLEAGTKSEV